jgi:hypothetical protein
LAFRLKPSGQMKRWTRLRPLGAARKAIGMPGYRAPNRDAHWPAFMLNVGLLAGAVGVAGAEGWDLNGDGALTLHEALLVPVRLLAFPVHVLLQLVPAPVLQVLGVPEARWPSSAFVAVALSLPLWGILVCGGLMVEAWLEMTWKAAGRTGSRRGKLD